jgi:hypothetical protein
MVTKQHTHTTVFVHNNEHSQCKEHLRIYPLTFRYSHVNLHLSAISILVWETS